jgi:hypothetical protein
LRKYFFAQKRIVLLPPLLYNLKINFIKKKILGGTALLAIAAVAAWNMNLNSQGNDLSDVSLANVEALAQESGGNSCSASANCYYGSQIEGSVSCTGTSTCTSGHEYVKCDGNTSKCA